MTLPKLTDAGDAVSVPTTTPVPLSGMLRVGFVALLVTVTDPLAAPAAVGAKVTVSDCVAPLARVNGVETLPKEKPLPAIDTLETVTGPGPALETVTVCAAELPTLTLPKFTDAGDEERVPGVVPVPESGIDKLGLDALLVTPIVPETAPVTVGAKVRLRA